MPGTSIWPSSTGISRRLLISSQNIASHAERLESPTARPAHSMSDMALAETLKLLFNITHFKPSLANDFTECVPSLFTVLQYTPLPRPPLQPSISTVINALMNLEIPQSATSKTHTERLIEILSQSINAYPEDTLDTNAMPLVTLLRRYYAAGPPEIKASLKLQLLPSEEAREQPLGKDETLPSRLLRISVSSGLLQLGKNISALLFELSDSDAAKFIHNIGYGYAAGFLATNQIAVPQEAMADAASSTEGAADINPITGQWRDREEVDNLPEMTEEEKEREAERLFVLFER